MTNSPPIPIHRQTSLRKRVRERRLFRLQFGARGVGVKFQGRPHELLPGGHADASGRREQATPERHHHVVLAARLQQPALEYGLSRTAEHRRTADWEHGLHPQSAIHGTVTHEAPEAMAKVGDDVRSL